MTLVGKNLPSDAGDTTDRGSISGSGRSPGGGHSNPLWFLPRESHGQRSLGGLQFMGSQRVGRDLLTEHVRRHHLVQPFHLTYRAKTGASDPESTVFVAEPMVAL